MMVFVTPPNSAVQLDLTRVIIVRMNAMTDNAQERIVTRHYANGIIAAQPAEKGFAFNGGNHTHAREYVCADLYTAVCAERDALKARAEAAEAEALDWRAQVGELSDKLNALAAERNTCPLGDDCDLTVAWMVGYSKGFEEARQSADRKPKGKTDE